MALYFDRFAHSQLLIERMRSGSFVKKFHASQPKQSQKYGRRAILRLHSVKNCAGI